MPPLDSDSVVVIGADSVTVPPARELSALHLNMRPRALAVGTQTLRAGEQPLDSLHWADSLQGGDSLSGAYVYVPPQCVGPRRCPLLVLLHGLGGDGRSMIELNQGGLQALADSIGIIVLTPTADDHTWTPPSWRRSRNLHRIEVALRYVLRHYAIDPTRIALGGGSNGGGMALVLGLANGDIFSRVLGFSPSISNKVWVFNANGSRSDGLLVAAIPRHGKPLIFIQHGDTLGRVLIPGMPPIGDVNTHMFAQNLRRDGYTVAYAVDAGPHGMPQYRASAGLRWLAASWAGKEKVKEKEKEKRNGTTNISPSNSSGYPSNSARPTGSLSAHRRRGPA